MNYLSRTCLDTKVYLGCWLYVWWSSMVSTIVAQQDQDQNSCYTCASALPADTEPNAKLALKYLLRTNYNLPPVHQQCNDSADPLFVTAPTEACPTADCVKVTVAQQGMEFFMRGCGARLFAANSSIPEDAVCDAHVSPSICRCDGHLCNRAAQDVSVRLVLVAHQAVMIVLCYALFT